MSINNFKTIVCFCSCLLYCIGCWDSQRSLANLDQATTQEAKSQPNEPATVDDHQHQSGQLPFSVQWIDAPTKVSDGETIRLETEIIWYWPLPNGLKVEVEIPSNVSLIEGTQIANIEPTTEGGNQRFVWSLQLNKVPTTDLLVQVSASGEGWGYHNKLVYRFGRPEPTLSVERTGPELVINGRNFGKGVSLAPKSQPQVDPSIQPTKTTQP